MDTMNRQVLGQKLNAQEVVNFHIHLNGLMNCINVLGHTRVAETYGYPIIYPKRKTQLAV